MKDVYDTGFGWAGRAAAAASASLCLTIASRTSGLASSTFSRNSSARAASVSLPETRAWARARRPGCRPPGRRHSRFFRPPCRSAERPIDRRQPTPFRCTWLHLPFGFKLERHNVLDDAIEIQLEAAGSRLVGLVDDLGQDFVASRVERAAADLKLADAEIARSCRRSLRVGTSSCLASSAAPSLQPSVNDDDLSVQRACSPAVLGTSRRASATASLTRVGPSLPVTAVKASRNVR